MDFYANSIFLKTVIKKLAKAELGGVFERVATSGLPKCAWPMRNWAILLIAATDIALFSNMGFSSPIKYPYTTAFKHIFIDHVLTVFPAHRQTIIMKTTTSALTVSVVVLTVNNTFYWTAGSINNFAPQTANVSSSECLLSSNECSGANKYITLIAAAIFGLCGAFSDEEPPRTVHLAGSGVARAVLLLIICARLASIFLRREFKGMAQLLETATLRLALQVSRTRPASPCAFFTSIGIIDVIESSLTHGRAG